jgi:ribonuclease VapC
MIVDSSVLVAILIREPEADIFIDMIGQTGHCKVAAPTLLETSIVLSARGGQRMLDLLDAYLAKARIATIPFTADHAAVARDAFLRYGKGRHPAGLNFGDCISYATARLEAMPLLFKGDDFRLTDVDCAA